MNTSLRRFVAALALGLATSAQAQPILVNNASLEIAETRYFLNADFRLDLTAPLLEALNNGVSLGFLVEFQLTRPRWYWFDEKTASETLEALGRVHGWPVLGQDQVDNGRAYIAAVRLRLDPAQLPTPFRVSAVTNREWTLTSDWKRFRFTPLAPVQEAR